MKETSAKLLCAALAVMTAGLSACSPSLFFGNDRDNALLEAPGYRKINAACARIELSSPTLDVPTLQSLVKCFNAHGAMDAIEQLVEKAPREHVEAIVQASNKYLMGDARTLFELERTHQTLRQRGTLDESLRQLGRILENEEFVSSGLALLKDEYEAGVRSNGKLLRAFELLSQKLEPATLATALDAALTLAESRSFTELQTRFRGESPRGRSLEEIARGLQAYLNQAGDPGHPDLGKSLMRAVAEDGLLEILDEVVGGTPEEFRVRIPRAAAFLKASLAEDARLLDSMTSLFHYLHKEPIACLGGAKAVQDGVLHVIRELSEHSDGDFAGYLLRENLLTLSAMSPFCTYPQELARHYPAMIELAETSAMEPAGELLRAFYRAQKPAPGGGTRRPLIDLLVALLADTGSGPGRNPLGLPEDRGGIKLVLPALAELNDREAWEGLILVAALLPVESRAPLKELIAYLAAPRAELDGQSVYDILADAVSHASPKHLYGFLYSLRRFTESDEPLLGPSLRSLRESFHANDAHPLIRIVQGMLADATKNREFFDAVFAISETREFRDTVKLLSGMAKDGRLRDLIESVTVLYRRFAETGRHPITEGSAPAFVPKRRHDLTVAELVAFPLVRRPPAEGTQACRKLDLDFPLDQYARPGHDDQISHLLSCLNAGGRHQDAVDAVEFLRGQRTEDGRSFLAFQIDLLKGLNLARAQLGFLADRFMEAFDDGRLDRLLDAVPFWFSRTVPGGDAAPGTVVEPLLEALRPLGGAEARAALGRLGGFGAQALRRDDFPRILETLDEALRAEPEPGASVPRVAFDRARIAAAVRKNECRSSGVEERVDEIIDEFLSGASTWDTVGGKPRRGWDWKEFRAGVDEALEKMGRRHNAGGGRHAHEAMLSILRYFSLPDALDEAKDKNRFQHYHASSLLRYLRDRAVDYRPITYYYPGDKAPRVRLVNSLDRLELVLLDADFVAPVLGQNYGIKFLMDIAEAWGDEPYEIWPEEIKQKQARGEAIKTLADVVADIESTQANFEKLVGFPKTRECGKAGGGFSLAFFDEFKPHIYNIRQVLPIMAQERDNGGLRVLRDLFFEVHNSTPEKKRVSKSPDNHLTIVMKLVRMGVFRNLGRAAMRVSSDDPAALALMNGLVQASVVPETSQVMDALLVRDRKRELAWKLIEPVFRILDRGDAGELESLRQLAVHLGANLSGLGIAGPMMKTVNAVVEREGAFLGRNADILESALTSRVLARAAQALHEAADSPGKQGFAELARDALSDPARGLDAIGLLRTVMDDSRAAAAWSLFVERARGVTELPEYRRLRTGELLRELLEFLEERSAEPVRIETSRRLRLFLSERLENRDFEQFLALAAREPEGVRQVLGALSRAIESGELREFLALARRSLSPSRN
ncbi:MAG: hypothetical protein NDJ89_01765 [Oligoflexia bacterium]|nr:hypothetical protein [Oligoflexia bacterium]